MCVLEKNDTVCAEGKFGKKEQRLDFLTKCVYTVKKVASRSNLREGEGVLYGENRIYRRTH